MSKSRVQAPKKFGLIFLIPIFLLGFFVFIAKASETNHLVISAIQITEGDGKTNHDFIEIYNPTSSDINLKGYRLVKRTKAGTTDTSIKSWTDDAIIKAHGWRLWASSDDAAFPGGLGADDLTSQTIAADNGIAIRMGAADTGEIIDSIAWGAAENIFKEGSIPVNPAASESLVRKPGNGNGNGEDTNNNANDFSIILSFTLHNSSSPAQPAVAASDSTPSDEQNISDQDDQSVDNSGSTSDNLTVNPKKNSEIPSIVFAKAGTDKETVVNKTIPFDGSDSFDSEGKKLIFGWDFGDGTKASGMSVSHAFKEIGEYRVSLKASNGSYAAEDFLNVKVVKPEFSYAIAINEILPDPVGTDKNNEWIEVINFGDKKINLLGWALDDDLMWGGKPYVFSDDTFIEPNDFLVVKRSKDNLIMPNSGGEVNLLWYGEVVSKVSYGESKEDKSYAFTGGHWEWIDLPTPGKENSSSSNSSQKPQDKIVAASDIDKPISKMRSAVKVISKASKSDNYKDGENIDYQDESEKLSLTEDKQKNISASGNSGEIKGVSTKGNDFSDNNSSSAERQDSASGNTKNNPWFWGDMALSAMSLFLVWRYQSLKKKIK